MCHLSRHLGEKAENARNRVAESHMASFSQDEGAKAYDRVGQAGNCGEFTRANINQGQGV